MPAAPVIAVAALATAAVGTVATIGAQNRMAKAERQRYAYERQINQNRSVRERRDAIRAARMANASLVQNSENTGGSNTSAALGSLGSIQSQLNSNLSFLDTQQGLAERAGNAASDARAAQANASNWAAVTNLGMTVFNIADSRPKKSG